MITITQKEGLVTFTFENCQHYLKNGEITVPLNSLSVIKDESGMITLRKASSNDILFSVLSTEFDGMSPDDAYDYLQTVLFGEEGVTVDEVQEMIDAAISGVPSDERIQEITRELDTLDDAVSRHIADTTKHITAAERNDWNSKLDSDALDDYYTKDEIDASEEEIMEELESIQNSLEELADTTSASLNDLEENKLDVTAMTNNYYTKSEVDELIDGVEVDLSNYYTKSETDAEIASSLSTKLDKSVFDIKEEVISNSLNDLNARIEEIDIDPQDIEDIKEDISDINDDIDDIKESLEDISDDVDALGTSKLDKRQVQFLTRAQYDAIAVKENDVLYVITDEDPLDDYYTKSQVDALGTSKLDKSVFDIKEEVISNSLNDLNQTKASYSELTGHTSNTTIHVTASDKTNWNAKLDSSALNNYYTKSETTAQINTAINATFSYNSQTGILTITTPSV